MIWLSGANKFFGWFRRKQKERSVQGAGITPEAVPRKGREERNTGDRQRDSKGVVAGLRNTRTETGVVVFGVGTG